MRTVAIGAVERRAWWRGSEISDSERFEIAILRVKRKEKRISMS